MIKLCTILNDSQFNYFEVMIESYYKTQRVKHPWLLFDCGLSDENYSEQWKLYPVWAVGSYEQKTNRYQLCIAAPLS